MHPNQLVPWVLLCLTACPADTGSTAGPASTSSTGADPSTSDTLPTTGSAAPTSSAATDTPNATTGDNTTVSGTTSSPVSDATTVDPDPGTSAGTATLATTSETTAATSEETTADPDTTTGAMPGSLDCETLELSDPIIVDDLTLVGGFVDTAPLAISWRGDMLLARSTWDGMEGCNIWWEHRDDAGQLLGENLVIQGPNQKNQSCGEVGDIVWDAAHGRYIFIHSQGGPATFQSLPIAITPAGAVAWIASGDLRSGNSYRGVVSQLRIVGDELFVLGAFDSGGDAAGPAIHVYSTVDGAFLRATQPIGDGHDSAVACNDDCTAAITLYASAGGGPLYIQALDPTTGQLVGAPLEVSGVAYGGYFTGVLDWRAADDIFAVEHSYTNGGTIFRTNTLGVGVGWNGQPHQTVTLNADFYEPSWTATDDGYVVVGSGYPNTGSALPDDFRKIYTAIWNIAHDGTIREYTTLPESGHSARIAYKAGRLAITYVHLKKQVQMIDSRRLVFAACPP